MDYPNPQQYYKKEEVDAMIAEAVAQAHEADRILMSRQIFTCSNINLIVSFVKLFVGLFGFHHIIIKFRVGGIVIHS